MGPTNSTPRLLLLVLAAGIAATSTDCTPSIDDNATIELSPTTVVFEGVQGGPNPAPKTVGVSNGAGGTLLGLEVGSGLDVGPMTYLGPNGWLTASLDQNNAPATLTLQVNLGSLQPNMTPGYTASVCIQSRAAFNSPRCVSVTLRVRSQRFVFDKSRIVFSGATGTANPASQTVSISNGGGSTLSE